MTAPSTAPRRSAARTGRWVEAAVEAALRVACRLLPVLPTPIVVALADLLGTLLWLTDVRGRSVGMQNLAAALGGPRRRLRAVLRASYRNAVLCEALLFHLQPLTPERFSRFVRIAPEQMELLRRYAAAGWRGVMVSGHFGNWELLLAARSAVEFAPPFAYLAETSGSPSLDATLERLRDRGSGGAALRKRGALALRRALADGKCVSFMIDRNLRGEHGGAYVPFLGLEARTTPLGARLALAYGVPMVVTLLIPEGRLRWRFAVSHDVMPPASGDAEADVRQGLAHANEILSQAIRAHPEAYLWVLKRFKSRPTPEQGRYPAYSFHDPA